jgi:hypothetical protein
LSALLETIREYQAGVADFNLNAPEDDDAAEAYADVSYGPGLARLQQWNQQAESLEEAAEALRISLTDKGGVASSEAAVRMVKAAHGYIAKSLAVTHETSFYHLMAIYWDRYESLDQAMDATDATDAGTPERSAAEARQFSAGDQLSEASCAICAYVPRRRMDARIKADFLRTLAAGNGGQLEKEEEAALLSSLSDLVAWQGQEART